MRISRIEKQKKEKQRCNIFIDGIFKAGLYEDTVVKFGLRSGDEISEKEFEKIREYDEYNYAKASAYKFLSYRQRSKKEMITKLKQKKLPDTAINKVIKLLEEQKYLNDEIFADNFVKEQIRNKKAGRRTLIGKLLEKGISREISETVVSENYPANEEFAAAEKVLAKFIRTGKFKNDYDKKSKCFRHLISKGFDTDTANTLLTKSDI